MTNPLSSIDSNASTWIGDGTEGATLTVNGSAITLASAKRGTPYNVRLDSSTLTPTDNLYYEVELVGECEGNLAVGLVTSTEFQPGWKSRGMFYNGNVTNGSAGLRIGFGDHPKKSGDRVGVYLLRNGSECRVVYYINGRCLGAGFAVTSSADTTFYPCLHLDGRGTVNYSAPASFPTTTDRESATFGDAYSGEWVLSKAQTGPELHDLPLPEDAKIVLSFALVEPNAYRLSIKVANTFNTSVKLVGKMESFDKIEIGPAMATRMMPPPPLQPVESFVEQGLSTLYKMIVSETGSLVMTGPAAEMICARYEKTFEPVTSYQ
mmetsp:Transcript_13102/g.28425  ORF Transcript_13102/g.28425 Transcript_13102/m.28425 type:complete len:321 (+) Transcript_13102:138-1100(+)|eukprot:CAMPEP_0178500422 /NCGR_PEP_ID=MMETSP0696-20121128/16375_1 /TAXON_ID=265572 /ORGANISM="Extubocellulus spinifer, Strain CCMP396" /LENGTH=320 /DNA_ID=CAMNT_0020129237 /DNA_START=96 /DNA_END=1058 /DNA_ORIENTATION=+